MPEHYDEPTAAARVANAAIRWLAEHGVSIAGTRALRIRGRRTGEPRPVVVNVLTVDGIDYLVSPRGDTQWARNLRAAGELEIGPRWARVRRRAAEVPDDDKPALLRRYLDRWHWEVRGHFGGLTPSSDEAEIRRAASSIPVFALAR